MRKFIVFVSGMFAGALVGGVAALLLAPEAGEELRKKALVRFDSLIEDGKKAAEARRTELRQQLYEFKRGSAVTLDIPQEAVESE